MNPKGGDRKGVVKLSWAANYGDALIWCDAETGAVLGTTGGPKK